MAPSASFLIVAIDGGAAAGKSSTARALSERFHLLHSDTGSYFRALTAELLRRPIGNEIRSAAVNGAVSHFAAIPDLRTTLMHYERGQAQVARDHGFRGLVMDGRDIGSVIFPSADFRFFLYADPAERARRRAEEGQPDAVAERDRLDSSRSTAPLACPAGAISIDSTHLNLGQVVARMAAAIAERLGAA